MKEFEDMRQLNATGGPELEMSQYKKKHIIEKIGEI